MQNMFSNCNKLTSLNLTHYNTSLVTNMSSMFDNCYSLESLEENFDTRKVNRLDNMFSNCNKLTSLNLIHYNTSLVTNMSSMFNNCYSLENLDITFNTSIVKLMQKMFSNCTKLISLNISTFNTSSCNNFTDMFKDDDGLVLYLDKKICGNLIDELPDYVDYYDIHENGSLLYEELFLLNYFN